MELTLEDVNRERFWSKVRKAEGCWEWAAGRGTHGYGVFHVKRVQFLAHRISYELSTGRIPEGMQIDHLCRNRGCVNPEHLEVVTPAENQYRSTSVSGVNRAKTHCHRGHPFNETNTLRFKGSRDGRWHRMCKACSLDNQRRRRAALKREAA